MHQARPNVRPSIRLNRSVLSRAARSVSRFAKSVCSIAELEPRRLFAGPPFALQSPIALPGTFNSDTVHLADMNNDGKLDAVSVGALSRVRASQVAIFLGNGDGTFRAPLQTLSFGDVLPDDATGILPSSAIADMNRDGKPDLVLSRNNDAAVHIWYGNGDGTFGATVRTPMPSFASFGPNPLEVGDLNGDQWPDVAVGRNGDSRVIILFGGPTFAATNLSKTLTNDDAGLIESADFDGNGIADLVVAGSSGLTFITGFNQPVQSLVNYPNLWAGKILNDVVVGNLLGPGNLPGVTVSAVNLGTGSSRIIRMPRPMNSSAISTLDINALAGLTEGDFNRDGYSDVIVNSTFGIYYQATGNSTGALDFDTTARAAGDIVLAATADDVNNDGYLDYVMARGNTGAAALLQIPESLTVTTAVDEDDGTASPGVGNGTSLREAVGYAARLTGGTVTFAPALGNANAVINLTRGIMPTGVSSPNITIRNDAGRITIDGSGNGGAPFVSFFGSLTVRNLTFRNFNYGNNGGVFYVDFFSPNLTIDGCTFTGNVSGGQGSVVYAADASPVTIRNSTFTGNGGNSVLAFRATQNGQYITLQNNTIYGNTANGVAALTGNVNLQNNIIANNGTSDVVYAGGGFVGFNNIIRTGGGPAGSLNVDPLLGALANNGGPTSTFMPAPNSPAINAAAAIGFTVDQRGTARPQGALPDVGAVERAATAAQITAATFESATRQAVNFTFNAEASVGFSRANITLTNLTTNQVSSAGTLTWNAAGTQASLVLTNLLADGNYRLQSGTTTLDFHVLGGDFNRDRTANFDDLLILAANYNLSGKNNTQGDANYDGVVNFDDLLLLAGSYDKSVAGSPSSGLVLVPPPAPNGPSSIGRDDDDTSGADVLS